LGSAARYGVASALPVAAGTFPLPTFVVNVSGAALIAVVLVVMTEHRPVLARYRPFVATGVLGGWTTMSSLAADLALLVRGGHALLAAAYLAATVVGSAAAAVGGAALARRSGFSRVASP
jgi:fluoride exporter